jgi:hypothetical protein
MVEVKAGRAVRKYRAVRKSGPDDLVFQSVVKGAPMRDNNILVRHIKPAAKTLGLPVNWQILRRSIATWLKIKGADEGRAGADAALQGQHDLGCVSAVRSRVSTEGGGRTGQLGHSNFISTSFHNYGDDEGEN